ncbi:PREDICTED: LDLR chaperone MESD [Phaethon lepturus]|uniref:LDLR chaperone MESD n=1 Tax=Phaethon lepturus TaxID=97097 RepID=UPI00053098BF|nr:PREDICTED: LDLR chaperone MESD [Phaethon lepturus]
MVVIITSLGSATGLVSLQLWVQQPSQERAATSLFGLLCCLAPCAVLVRNCVHDCPANWESDLVQNTFIDTKLYNRLYGIKKRSVGIDSKFYVIEMGKEGHSYETLTFKGYKVRKTKFSSDHMIAEKDDDIEEGDLPEHKRPPAPIDFSKIDPGKPESILKLTKKGKTLMMFVTVSGNPTEKETEEITSLWQGSLFNANYDVQRFIVGSNRAIFMLRDGGYAWEIKDFLINQERCADVTLEGQVYPGKGAKESEKVKNKTKPEKAKKKKDADKKSNSVKEDNRATKQRDDL